MIDLDSRFRDADDIEVRDVWADITSRTPGRLPDPRPRHKVLALVVALVVAGAGIALAVLMFGPHDRQLVHRPELRTASELAGAIRRATGQCLDPGVPFGPLPFGATQDIQCTFDGESLVLLSFDLPAKAPTAPPGLRDRVVIFGPKWNVIAPDLDVARQVQSVTGGRMWVTPALVSPHVRQLPTCTPQMDCVVPIRSVVRFRLLFTNPLDRAARMTCSARGISSDGQVLFRTMTFHGPVLPAHSSGRLVETVRKQRPGTVGHIVAWCIASPTHPEAT